MLRKSELLDYADCSGEKVSRYAEILAWVELMVKSSREEILSAAESGVLRLIASAVIYNHEIANRLGLGASDAQFLTLLQFHGPLTPGQLASRSGLSTGTVTGVIDRLEQAGFARRGRDPSDRRKVIVSLEPERIEREIAPLYTSQARHLSEVLAHYDASHLDVIVDFLDRLTPPLRGGQTRAATA